MNITQTDLHDATLAVVSCADDLITLYEAQSAAPGPYREVYMRETLQQITAQVALAERLAAQLDPAEIDLVENANYLVAIVRDALSSLRQE